MKLIKKYVKNYLVPVNDTSNVVGIWYAGLYDDGKWRDHFTFISGKEDIMVSNKVVVLSKEDYYRDNPTQSTNKYAKKTPIIIRYDQWEPF